MIVKQIYAGWIGVIAGNKIHNGVIEFELSPDRRQQLIRYNPNHKEREMLRKRIIEANPYGHKQYTSQLGGPK